MNTKIKFGYALLTEQFAPKDLVSHAQAAQDAGLDYLTISDHFHPWIRRQGNSPFVWSMLGALSQVVNRMEVGTAVTCPILRYHPAIIAQAAATASIMFGERFFLGVGTGENLNEHIVGFGWPDIQTRLFMIEEAVAIIRLLWEGGMQDYTGVYFSLENAELFNLPQIPPKIVMAASGTKAATTAGIIADGLMTTNPDEEIVNTFIENSGAHSAVYGQIIVCYDTDTEHAKQTVHKMWPTSAMPGQLNSELSIPQHFESVAELLTIEQASQQVICGDDVDLYVKKISEYIQMGYTHIHIAQIGENQEEFIKFYKKEIIPNV